MWELQGSCARRSLSPCSAELQSWVEHCHAHKLVSHAKIGRCNKLCLEKCSLIKHRQPHWNKQDLPKPVAFWLCVLKLYNVSGVNIWPIQKMGIPPTYEPCCGFCIHSARTVGLVSIGTMGKWRKSSYLKPSCILPLQDCNEALGTDPGHWSDPLRRKVSLPFLQHGKARGACILGSDLVGSKASDEDGVAAVNTQNHRASANKERSAQPPQRPPDFQSSVWLMGELSTSWILPLDGYAKGRGVRSEDIVPDGLGCLIFVLLVPPTSQKGNCICPSSFSSLLHQLKGKGSLFSLWT